MKKLSKAHVGALCATLLFAAPLPAFAQGIAVHDSANLIQQINAVRQAIQVVAQGKQQIAEAQKLYQDLNKLTDIPQLAQQLKSDALRELDISGGSLEGFGNGNLDVVGAGRAKADAVWCSSNRNDAFTRAKRGETIKAASCGKTPVADDYAMGREFGVRGTPAIVLADGEMVPGYLPPALLAKRLQEPLAASR
jgi:protein-disulfide isomerase